jgi:hypothetical protein
MGFYLRRGEWLNTPWFDWLNVLSFLGFAVIVGCFCRYFLNISLLPGLRSTFDFAGRSIFPLIS